MKWLRRRRTAPLAAPDAPNGPRMPRTAPGCHQRLTRPQGAPRWRVAWPGSTPDEWLDYADEENAEAMADELVKTKRTAFCVVYRVNVEAA